MTYLSPFVFQDAYLSSFYGETIYKRAGLASILWTNLLLTAPTLVLLFRWRLRFGSLAMLWSVPVLAVVLTNEATDYPFVLSVFGASLATDLLVRMLQASALDRARFRSVAFVGPIFLWSAYFATVATHLKLAWEPELWVGSIVWTSASSLAVAELMLAACRTGSVPVAKTQEPRGFSS